MFEGGPWDNEAIFLKFMLLFTGDLEYCKLLNHFNSVDYNCNNYLSPAIRNTCAESCNSCVSMYNKSEPL